MKNFKTWLEGKTPFTPDHILPNAYNSFPPHIRQRIPYMPGQKEIWIYHGGSWPDDPLIDIYPGDWITLSRSYAKTHAKMRGSNKVIKKKVPVEHVSWSGTDENEWFYTPPT